MDSCAISLLPLHSFNVDDVFLPVNLDYFANLLPFVHGAELEKALFSGSFSAASVHILPVLLYSILTTLVATACFLRQMKKQ